MLEKKILGFFERGLNVFDPKIAIRCAQDNLEVKKVLALSNISLLAKFGLISLSKKGSSFDPTPIRAFQTNIFKE